MTLTTIIQTAKVHRGRGTVAIFRHLGALGLFPLAILDSSPLPTFGGTDIVTAILAASHRNPWYEYAAVATLGSVIGAYLTFRIGRRAGVDYLGRKFKTLRVASVLKFFQEWGSNALAVSTAVPIPFPTSVFFAAAGATNYNARKFVALVSGCRAARYALVAIVAERYGRPFIHVLRHPAQDWQWVLLLAAVALTLMLAGMLLNRRLAPAYSERSFSRLGVKAVSGRSR